MRVPRRKPKANVMVADGAGGMVKIEDRRFDQGHWPIRFEVPAENDQADRWFRYVNAECRRRGWSAASLGQLDRAENSGTLNINPSPGKPPIEGVWERQRDGPIKVRARGDFSAELSLAQAEQFFWLINEACRLGTTEPIYARGTLQYDGLAWRGELWLDEKVRLGPPSKQDETATIGPRVVHVDAMLDCIGESDVAYVRDQTLSQVAAFLSVIMRKAIRYPEQGRTWTWVVGTPGCAVRHLGYMEVDNPVVMPEPGSAPEVPLYLIDQRPRGIFPGDNEQTVRDDFAQLWLMFRSLPPEKSRQFLQAAAKWQEAMMHWQDRSSLSFALMVVACEALKPVNDDSHNIYHVIEALLGRPAVNRIRQQHFPAQRVRSTHLHTGEFHGSELIRAAFMSSYRDPTFREAHRALAAIVPDAIIEWLKRGGVLTLPTVNHRRSLRRFIKDHVFAAMLAVLAFGVAIGFIITAF
jgi:hypothetical protein